MKNKVEPKGKSFFSLTEIEKRYLPTSYRKKIREQKMLEPGAFGAGLANELISNIRKRLSQ